MTFQELVAEVMLLTRRPDLVDRTESAVRAATLKAHHSDFYYKDIYEQSITFVTPAYVQNFLPTDIFPTFRKAKYLRIWETDGSINGYPGKFLVPIQIENSLDAYKSIKTDVFYQAGQLLQVRLATASQYLLFGAYLHPTITPEGAFCSWIASEMPWAIIYEAARVIFKSIGMDQQTAEMTQLVGEQYSLLKMSYIDDLPVT
jgi:hypothetical protein